MRVSLCRGSGSGAIRNCFHVRREEFLRTALWLVRGWSPRTVDRGDFRIPGGRCGIAHFEELGDSRWNSVLKPARMISDRRRWTVLCLGYRELSGVCMFRVRVFDSQTTPRTGTRSANSLARSYCTNIELFRFSRSHSAACGCSIVAARMSVSDCILLFGIESRESAFRKIVVRFSPRPCRVRRATAERDWSVPSSATFKTAIAG